MSETEYLSHRAEQERQAAKRAFGKRARHIHLQLAEAYAFRLREGLSPAVARVQSARQGVA